MSNPSKRKGSSWERALADYLNASGVFVSTVERAPQWGAADRGDLVNTGQFTVEAKAVRQIDLASFVDEAAVEAENAGTRWGVAIIKRRNKPTGQAYVVLPLDAFIDLLGELPDALR